MARGPKLVITLTAEEQQTLEMWAGARKGERRLVERAEVVLLSAQGLPLREVSRRSGLSPQNCSKWRKRFSRQGLAGLQDRPRSGRPPVLSAHQRLEVVALATSKPTDGSTRWSTRKLARETGIGPTSVHRILKEGQLKPHKTEYWCGRSPDPEFEAKQAAILGLYLDPPNHALVLCVDEKSQIQALDRTQPELPMRAGNARRLTATYRRHGTTCLLAALSVHTGEVSGRCVDKNDHSAFLNFLKALYRQHPGKELHVILDNLSVHKHHQVQDWVRRRRRLSSSFRELEN